MARPVPIAPCRSPFAASRPAPSCAPRPRAAPRRPHLPNPTLVLSARVGLLRLGRQNCATSKKSAQLLRETCRLFAQLPFIVLDAAHPADRACCPRVHTAGDNPDGKPAKNTLFPTFPRPAARCPRKIGTLCKSFAKNSGFSRDFEGKNERKNSPSELFYWPFSPKTGEKRAENNKQALRIVHFVVFLTSWLPTDATILRRKTQNQHFSAQLFRRCKSKTDGHFRHNTHKSTLQNEEIRKNSAFL